VLEVHLNESSPSDTLRMCVLFGGASLASGPLGDSSFVCLDGRLTPDGEVSELVLDETCLD
jgi:hypothetical protein